ncbi:MULTISPECIES: hypothetical protein [Leifsonia]|uniref:Uncharacterized protein n=1 Tax=Leifsonia soli TaxID=582665 RepID=A0A852SXA6_9MICO|nr:MULTISPECIES: hypothetical protein [Leifsonia]NYD73778.1 hypothetical protein [Leifsonia soli]SEA74394.1 hypothetical protein SAMN04515680_1380 [Leifsonia sp. 21MFCrub1.1]
MPTQLARTQITHTPHVQRALDTAREQWSDDTDGKLLVHLIELGEQALRESRSRQIDDRLAELDRISARYSDLTFESLDSIREGWPE